nr:hypothetical protein BaRGS_028939 [Batillaria attramentaria]
MAARPTKCQLGELEIAFLGHVLSEGRVRPEQDKLDKIGAAAAPRTKKELRSFLGLAGFYRKFVPRYAELALPLTDRTKKNQPERVDWGETCQQAFDAIRKALESGAFLQLPDNRFPYVLRTDASGTGLGAALMQDQGQGLLPVAFASKKLSSAERYLSSSGPGLFPHSANCAAPAYGLDHSSAPDLLLTQTVPLSRRLTGAPASGRISEGNDQTAERGAATGVGHSSLDREHPTAMKDCCA